MSCGCAPLALSRTPDGWVQKSSFTHPDLHDELVEEFVSITSPLAPRVVSGVAAFTFVMLGDQNAGKSTFLHAFTHSAGASWLELLSLLPILSSSFANVQLASSTGMGPPAMDEPPFIDTDVGRATFLLTLEDFAFFVDEFGLPLPHDHLQELAVASGVRYAIVELIEIGGDHIDRMMTSRLPESSPNGTTHRPPSLMNALRRSEELLAGAHRTLYFLNAATLLSLTASRRLCLEVSAVACLVRRLRYLADVLPLGQRVQLHLCRLPDEHEPFGEDDVHGLVDRLNA
jgi:hypothetical protein